MKKGILFTFVLYLSISLSGCARNPVTGKRQIVLVSESQEIAMGRESDPQVREEYGVAENPALQTYVQTMGRKLVRVSHRPNLEWYFTVVDSSVVTARSSSAWTKPYTSATTPSTACANPPIAET